MAAREPFIQVSINPEQLKRLKSMLSGVKNGSNRAMSRALNETSNQAKIQGIRKIREQVRLKSKFLGERISSAKDSFANSATPQRLSSQVTAQRRGLLMAHFLTTKVNVKPIRTKIKPTGKSTLWRGAFFVRLRKGVDTGDKYGVFVRSSGDLKHLYGPSPSQVWTDAKDEIAPGMNLYLQERLDKQIAALLRTG
jgi:hypothetical protein